ncbi:MAG: Regulator of chromosome condensation [Parcubacteria group bacterium GW2011_GWA2_38_13]|nr:MAG: Regulator of chromosome condensation [Parcubacteria group bacterium GW2011_GWA2_38_13]
MNILNFLKKVNVNIILVGYFFVYLFVFSSGTVFAARTPGATAYWPIKENAGYIISDQGTAPKMDLIIFNGGSNPNITFLPGSLNGIFFNDAFFSNLTHLSASTDSKIVNAIKAVGNTGFTFDVWYKPSDVSATVNAPIIASSLNNTLINFAIIQEGRDVVFKGISKKNLSSPPAYQEIHRCVDCLLAGTPYYIGFSANTNNTINYRVIPSGTINITNSQYNVGFAPVYLDYEEWDASWPFHVGSYWPVAPNIAPGMGGLIKGDIYQLAFYNKSLTPEETANNYFAGYRTTDLDGDGHASTADGGEDCNDSNANIHPGLADTCETLNIDDDCSGTADEDEQVKIYYRDNDGDTFGNTSNSATQCLSTSSEPTKWVLDNADCNDNNASIKPGAIEICDNIDNNCNASIDEGFTQTTYYLDNDGDGRGVWNGVPQQYCTGSQPAGWVTNNNDCDDSDVASTNEPWCHIGGTCIQNLDRNSANQCQQCMSAVSHTAWQSMPPNTSCSDGNACTNPDTCQAGACSAGAAISCAAATACKNASTCNIATGACSIPINKVNGTGCSDGNACTNPDTCQAGSCTSGIAIICASATDCKSASACNTATGACSVPINKANGIVCGDLNADGCSYDTCNAGICTAGVTPPPSCVDGNACTQDVCTDTANPDKTNYSCAHPAAAGKCVIGGTCYANGDKNPANDCQYCNTALGTSVWSNYATTQICNKDSNGCTKDDKCNGTGTCVAGTNQACDDSKTCTTDSCTNTGTAANQFNTFSCSNPVNVNTCLIAGVCKNENDTNGTNTCQICKSASSKTAWTNQPNITACNKDSNGCTLNDKCSGLNPSTCVAGAAPNCEETPANLCTADACTSTGNNTYNCTHAAVAGKCVIGGVCYANGDKNPVNDCQYCNTAANTFAWSNYAATQICNKDSNGCTKDDKCNGTGTCVAGTNQACDDSKTCTTDSCTNTGMAANQFNTFSCNSVFNGVGCFIASSCYAANVVNPGNKCQMCNPATNSTGWTPKNCNDLNACTSDSCNLGSGACVNTNTVVCNTPPNIAPNSAQCYNSPGTCTPATGICNYTPKPNTESCIDGLVCTENEKCNGAGSCLGTRITVESNCDDGIDNDCDDKCDTSGCAGMAADLPDCSDVNKPVAVISTPFNTKKGKIIFAFVGTSITIDASLSRDPRREDIEFSWIKKTVSDVTLAGTDTQRTTLSNLTKEEILEIELTVKNESKFTGTDRVFVVVSKDCRN